MRNRIEAGSRNWGQLAFRARDSTYSLVAAGLGGLMAMTEVEESSRLIMERTFYIKLGPTPAFPPSPAETGQAEADSPPPMQPHLPQASA